MIFDIDETHSVDCKDGYYLVRVHGIAKSGKHKGDKVQLYRKTYPTIFGAWDKLKELGVDGGKALAFLEKAKQSDVVVITEKALNKRGVKS